MKRNSFFFGGVLGLIMPIIAHLLTLFTTWNMAIGNKSLSLYVIAALINLLFVRFFYRNALEKSARGVILITFVAAIVLIFTENLSA